MKKSPTARTLNFCRENGWTADVVERWIPQAGKRKDLFGIIDCVVLDGNPGPLGVQATTWENRHARRAKALDEPRLALWLAAGCRFEVWAWKRPGRGRRAWTLERIPLRLLELLC